MKPTQPGGGTVNYVYNNTIDYIQDVELKEESGTPNIIGSIRLGLMISVMSKIPHKDILLKEEKYIHLFLEKLNEIPNLNILHGNLLKSEPHIPVFSFMISFNGRFLHPNYVCALLNDLFGIQSRPGCSCAPNYGKYLLGFDKDEKQFKSLEKLIKEGKEIFKPGYTRLNLPYFYPEYIIDYVIEAIKLICEYGNVLLGLYNYDINTGKFYYFDSSELPYNLNLFVFTENLPKTKNLYDNKNHRLITPTKLKKIFDETKRYILSRAFLQNTFYYENDAIKPKRTYQDFGEDEKTRWFCVFKDVIGMLKKIYFFELCSNNLVKVNSFDEIRKMIKNIEGKEELKENDWSIKYQNKLTN